MGRTACTEPQYLCKGALYIALSISVITNNIVAVIDYAVK